MSDLEQFAASEGQDSDPKAVEQLRERMRANAAQIKQIKKEEGKQKKKEDDLAQIIVQYLKTQQKRDIMLLVLRCLEQGIPPVFVLGIISLTEDQLQASPQPTSSVPGQTPRTVYTNALSRIGVGDDVLGINGQFRLNAWIENLKITAEEKKDTLKRSLKDNSGHLKIVIIQLTSFILREFLKKHRSEIEFKKLQAFAQFILSSL